jgi:hypothetical protein
MAILPDWADVLVLVALGISIATNVYQFVRLRCYKYDNLNENVRIAFKATRDAAMQRSDQTIRIREHAGRDVIPPACYVLGVP